MRKHLSLKKKNKKGPPATYWSNQSDRVTVALFQSKLMSSSSHPSSTVRWPLINHQPTVRRDNPTSRASTLLEKDKLLQSMVNPLSVILVRPGTRFDGNAEWDLAPAVNYSLSRKFYACSVLLLYASLIFWWHICKMDMGLHGSDCLECARTSRWDHPKKVQWKNGEKILQCLLW